MSTRKVTILSTKTNEQKDINTDVTTWGELQPLIKAAGIDPADMKAMDRASRASFEHAGAILPTGDFVLFLTPGKIKSGNNN